MLLASTVRVTARKSAVWRTCGRCSVLSPLAPDETRCRACAPGGKTCGKASRGKR
ncbi:hypothetical protein GCM10009557_26870 [Virgisporangium ochraceum]|uniref:Uncharacterized protein n=1 Tax=Virgisporangium ochraceum TaxID=65505 RepID=A0A8J4E8G1_9ACTN|nr:hypothetical protein Voc01_005530 [Virgisporangium ochraceum]